MKILYYKWSGKLNFDPDCIIRTFTSNLFKLKHFQIQMTDFNEVLFNIYMLSLHIFKKLDLIVANCFV
jgi:hypothetical protein